MTDSPDDGHRPEPPPADRPLHINAAATLLILSALLAATIAVNDPEMTQFVSLLFFVTIGAALRFCRGGRTARITATVTAALFLLYLGPHAMWGVLDPGGFYQPEYAVRAILAVVASGTGVSLLYVPRSRAYFAHTGARPFGDTRRHDVSHRAETCALVIQNTRPLPSGPLPSHARHSGRSHFPRRRVS